MEILKNTIYSNSNSNPSSINKKKIEEIYKKNNIKVYNWWKQSLLT